MGFKCCLLVFLLIVSTASSQQTEGKWSEWGKWTTCTRTCGGGITKITRECIPLNNNTEASCTGDAVSYRMCNIQDCSDDIDFRMLQCSNYNKYPYKGKNYTWASFEHRAGECELKCMPKGERFFKTFQNKVIDGTTCNSFTRNVCVDGKCVKVGCDMQLYSSASLDECGVCNGDGSTCRYISSDYRLANDAYDYVDITTIPSGATNIKIYEEGTPSNYLALRNNDENVLNGDYIFAQPGLSKYQGSIISYERSSSLNQLKIDGPTELPLQLLVFVFSSNKPRISYEYYMPRTFRGEVNRQNEYQWSFGSWGECSKTCAEGTRRREVFCINKNTNRPTKSFFCVKTDKPATEEICNAQPCPPQWYISQWSPCSTTCGEGIQSRRVHCVETIKNGNINMLDFNKCPGTPPTKVEKCVQLENCPVWNVGKWSQCSVTCGEGKQTRRVTCTDLTNANSVEQNKCSLEQKPSEEKTCFNAPCGSRWATEEWTKCSTHCGVGVRSRRVVCRSSEGYEVPVDYCSKLDEPTHFEQCNAIGPCKPVWHATQWSSCTARCGYGMQMRQVLCVEKTSSNLYVVDTKLCNETMRPIDLRRCVNRKPCYVNYFVSKWGECSSTCGVGIKTRKVHCYADRQVDHTDKACESLIRPESVKICENEPCDPNETTVAPTTTIEPTQPPVESAATIVSFTGPASLQEHENADYQCVVSGYPRPKVRWTLNGRPMTSSRFHQLSTKKGGRLLILAVNGNDVGQLKCTATNALGTDSSQIILSVTGAPSVRVTPKEADVNHGDQMVLRCQANGTPTPRVQWTKDGYTFYGDNNRVIVNNRNIIFKKVIPGDSGKYRCNAFNSAGSDSGLITVNVKRTSSETQVEDCYDDFTQADCNLIRKLNRLCDIPRYKKICCLSCQSVGR